MSNFFTAAKSDSCILAVHPWFDGSWWSKLNKGTLRDFSQGPKIWDSFYTVQNSLDLSHDYSFVCEFENTVKRGSVFYISSLRTVFGIFQFNSSSIIITSNLLQNTITGRKYIEVTLNQNGQPLTGRHSAKMTIIGNTATVYLDGNVIATVESDHIIRNVADEFEAPSSSCGYLYHITLADLTTDSVVWQPEHSDLYVQYVPHVFSTSTYWPGFISAFNSNGINGYHFSIKFSLSKMLTRDYVLFGNQMALGEGRFMLVLSSKGKIQVQDESSWSGMVEHPISGTGKHTVMITIAESSGQIVIDGVEYAVSVSRTSPILTIAFSKFPGTISSILLESDFGTLWQAAYSDLYDTLPAPPWPSPVPENFAENAKAFYDCQAVVREALDPTHDYSFLIDFKLDEAKTSGNVFYAIPSDAPFALILQSNNQIDFFTNLLKPNGDSNSFASIYAYYQSDVKLQGRHQIECKIEANMLSSYLDGVLVAQKTSNLERTGTVAVGLPNCNSGYVYRIQITDLTDNRTVWSYPSEAERVRLITKTNVRTDRGAFEAADHTVRWNVKTPLRWSALRRATVLVRTTVDVWNTTLISMGQPNNPNNAVFVIRRVTDSQVYFCIRGVDSNGNVTVSNHYAALTPQTGKFYDFAFTFDLDAKTAAYYLDGTLLKQGTAGSIVSLVPEDETLPGFMIGTRTTSDSVNAGNRTAYALVFNRALSEGEIKLLSTDNAV